MSLFISPESFKYIQEKTVFLLAVRKMFGLPFWERLNQADVIVTEESVPVGGSVRYAYISDRLIVRGFVSRILKAGQDEDTVPFRVFFSEIHMEGCIMLPEGMNLLRSDVERLYADRMWVEESMPAIVASFVFGSLSSLRSAPR